MGSVRRSSFFAHRVERVVARIPRGHVATYGQVASIAGSPRGARLVGWVLQHAYASVPWQRVVNREGRLSIVHPHLTAKTQATLLRGEGVVVRQRDGAYWVDLHRHLWHPRPRARV